MAYIGNTPAEAYTSFDKQTITGDGGASYTLDHAVANEQEIEVFVNNVRQEPSVAYTVSGTALTMTGNVESSDDFYVVFQGKAIQTTSHPEGQDLKARDGTFSGDVIADGNVGIGISPYAHHSGGTGLDVSKRGTVAYYETAGDFLALSNNAYYNGSNYIYKETAGAGQINIGNDGSFVFLTAPSGTAGTSLTYSQNLTIDSIGRVKMPNQPAFFAHGGTNIVKGTGSHDVIFSSTDSINRGSHYSTTNGRFTAPVAGAYFFTAAVRLDGANVQYFRIRLTRNGGDSYSRPHAIYDLGTNYDPRYHTVQVSGVINLGVNDYVTPVIYSDADGSFTIYRSESSFSGFFIG